jgi:hypothetical protein
MSNGERSTSTTLLSTASVLRMLRKQGINDLEDLIEQSLGIAEEDDEPAVYDLFISTHYVYVYSEPTTTPPTHVTEPSG